MKISLFVRTAFWLLLLSLPSTLLVGYLQMRIVETSLGKEFQAVKALLAERTAKNVSDFLNNVAGMLSTIGQLDEVSSLNPAQLRGVIRQLLHSHPVISEISFYDRGGHWVYGMERIPGSLNPAERRDRLSDFIRETVNRDGVFKGSILRVANYPGMEMFVPVKRGQAVSGYMRVVVSLAKLSEGLSEAVIGKTSVLFICDIKERLIAHSGDRRIFRADTAMPQLDPEIVKEIRKIGPYGEWTGQLRLSDGRDMVVALKRLGDLPWIAGTMQEYWEAFSVVLSMRQKIAEVLLAVTALVILAALYFAGHISSPVRSLTRAVRDVMMGDFTHPVENLPKPNDEIGELAGAFETMTKVLSRRTKELVGAQEELRRFNQELEDRVEARTKELKAMQDELIRQERLAAIGQMASVVGHELRNPLSVINNSIYVIKTRLKGSPNDKTPAPEVDPKVIKHVQSIEAELQVANQIISEILTFARTREVQLREVELHALLEDITSKVPLPENVQILKEYVNQPLHMKLDPDEMRQALRNLIGNAIDAMPNGGSITLSTRMNEKSVILSVSDTGSGIQPDILPKIFTPFFTSKPKGTGLGLAVVKKVMDRHNAEIQVESQLGRGTKFILKLPLL